MKVYRVSYRDSFSEHTGYEFLTVKAEAEKKQQKNNIENDQSDKVDEYEFELNKQSVLAILNLLASHPDNG